MFTSAATFEILGFTNQAPTNIDTDVYEQGNIEQTNCPKPSLFISEAPRRARSPLPFSKPSEAPREIGTAARIRKDPANSLSHARERSNRELESPQTNSKREASSGASGAWPAETRRSKSTLPAMRWTIRSWFRAWSWFSAMFRVTCFGCWFLSLRLFPKWNVDLSSLASEFMLSKNRLARRGDGTLVLVSGARKPIPLIQSRVCFGSVLSRSAWFRCFCSDAASIPGCLCERVRLWRLVAHLRQRFGIGQFCIAIDAWSSVQLGIETKPAGYDKRHEDLCPPISGFVSGKGDASETEGGMQSS